MQVKIQKNKSSCANHKILKVGICPTLPKQDVIDTAISI